MKIEFVPFTSDATYKYAVPKPSNRYIPDWYKQMPLHTHPTKTHKLNPDGTVNLTAKACSPMLDSLLMGYTISLNVDVQITKEESGLQLLWAYGDPIAQHGERQISQSQVALGYDPIPFKFLTQWLIRTPKGYSTLFTHPLNRTDLPFYTLSGVVETDTYNLPTQFPFLLRNDFEGIIEKGTPIVQLIPIKRESWKHEIDQYSEKKKNNAESQFYAKIERPYKNLFWRKKEYR